jgi:hypothetical protein
MSSEKKVRILLAEYLRFPDKVAALINGRETNVEMNANEVEPLKD